jgi:hypothetical protein
MILLRYQLNNDNASHKIPIIHPTIKRPSPIDDLQGFSPLPEGWTVRWDLFLNTGEDSKPQPSRRIDTQLSYNLAKLPSGLGEAGDDRSLAALDLLRGYRMELPSGQALARATGEEPLQAPAEEPLWYYILREAKELRKGFRLGPVGGRIVAEVLIGLLAGDPHSFLNVDPRWQPTYSSLGLNFELRDIVAPAQVA